MRRVLSAAALRACRQAPVRAPPATANSGRVPEAPLTRPELAPGVSACRAYGRSSAFSSPHADAAAKSATSKSGDTAAFKRSLDLIHFASIGDIEAVKRLVEQEGVPANSADYDKRSALHLAAAEGYLDVRSADRLYLLPVASFPWAFCLPLPPPILFPSFLFLIHHSLQQLWNLPACSVPSCSLSALVFT